MAAIETCAAGVNVFGRFYKLDLVELARVTLLESDVAAAEQLAWFQRQDYVVRGMAGDDLADLFALPPLELASRVRQAMSCIPFEQVLRFLVPSMLSLLPRVLKDAMTLLTS